MKYFIKKGNYENALIHSNLFYENTSDRKSPYLNSIKILYYNLKDYKKLCEFYESKSEIFKDNFEINFLYAKSLIENSRLVWALKIFNNLYFQKPNDFEVNINLAKIHLFLKDLDNAAKHISIALDKASDSQKNFELFSLHAKIMSKCELYDDAADSLIKSLEFCENAEKKNKIIEEIISFSIKSENFAEAKFYIDHLLTTDKTNPVLILIYSVCSILDEVSTGEEIDITEIREKNLEFLDISHAPKDLKSSITHILLKAFNSDFKSSYGDELHDKILNKLLYVFVREATSYDNIFIKLPEIAKGTPNINIMIRKFFYLIEQNAFKKLKSENPDMEFLELDSPEDGYYSQFSDGEGSLDIYGDVMNDYII